MPVLYWSPLAINLLVEIVLLGLISTFFGIRWYQSFRNGSAWRTTALLFGTFSTAGAGVALQFFSHTLVHDYANFPLAWVTPFATTAMACFVMYAFFLNGNWLLSRWIGWSLVIALAVTVTFETVVAALRTEALFYGYVEYRDAWTDIPSTLGFLAAQILFFVQLVAELAKERGSSWRSCFFPALAAVSLPTKPLNRDPAAARAFFYFTFTPLAVVVILLLRSFGLFDWRLTEIVTCWILMAIFAGFTLVYLNYIPEYSSFLVKLAGLSLTALLCVLSGISWLIGSVYAEAYVSQNALVSGTSYRFEPEPNGAYRAMRTGFHFDRDIGERITGQNSAQPIGFDFPFYGSTYWEIYPKIDGMIGFDHFPYWRDIQHRFGPQPAIFAVAADLVPTGTSAEHSGKEGNPSGLFVKSDPGRLVLTWNNLVGEYAPEDRYTFQVKLYPTGVVEIHYEKVPQNPSYDFYLTSMAPIMTGIVPPPDQRTTALVTLSQDLPFLAQPGQAILEYRRTEFREYLNRVYQPTALFIIASSFLVILLLPLFFRVNLDRPLKELISGVTQIRNGKLSTNINVFYRDEIGFLASSFNDMATAQNELLDSLEDKVAERSAEASRYAAQNARLQERNHLSQELHDAVSQTLFSANLISDTLPDLLEEDPERGHAALSEMRRLNKDALVEMRELLAALRQQKLTGRPFGSLLKDVVDAADQKFSGQITLEIEGDLTLPEDVQLSFYRIAQECLANAVKHSGADVADVYFDAVAEQAILVVSDNGCGFDTNVEKRGHFGLEIMQERMTVIGGSLEISSGLGQGTRVTALWGKDDDA